MSKLKAELKALVNTNPEAMARRVRETRGAQPADTNEEPGSPEWHADFAWRLMTFGMDEVALIERHLWLRRKLIRRLIARNYTVTQRFEKSVRLIEEQFLLVMGSADVLAILTGDVDHKDVPEVLSSAAILARTYLNERGDALADTPQVHDAIMRSYQAEGTRLLDMMRVIYMLTAKGSRLIPDDYPLRAGDLSSLLEQTSKLKIRWERENLSVGMVALPHGPMSTLTRETMNLGALVRHGQARWKKAAVKHVDEFVIVGDQRLVARRDESYIQVPLGAPSVAGQGDVVPEVADGQVIAALTQALMRMCRDHSPMLASPGEGEDSAQLELLDEGDASLAGLVEEIPRVVAGIFRAARVDRGLSFVGSGEFVDSTTATRLTDLIGLSGKTTRSRNRVAAVRAMLENVRLKRTVRSEDGKSLVTWEGPIIQRLKDKIDVETKLPRDYGLTSRHELGLWRIAPELWRMQDADGKAASFMLLDERAFSLSGLSPDPFNLYWTIIQRAYNAHRSKSDEEKFDDSGSFQPTLSVLYTWAGMDKKSDAKNMARARERMDEHLKSMCERELIVSYDADVFSPTRGLSLTSKTHIDIRLPPSLLCYLPNAAFRSGNNPFRRSKATLDGPRGKDLASWV